MRGATASVAGSRGIVPKPTAGQHTFMLLGDGTWGAQPVAGLPSQTSNSGKLLTTDGTNASWTTTGVLTSLTSPASTDLTLAGGSSGASLVLGQGSSATSLVGTGNVKIGFNAASGVLATFGVSSGSAGDGPFLQIRGKDEGGSEGWAQLVLNSSNAAVSSGSFQINQFNGASFNEVLRTTKLRNLLIGTTDETGLTGSGGLKIAVTTAGSSGAGALVVAGGLATGAASFFGGAVTVSTGNLVIGTAGNGIDFSADPSAAGMTSELLDDYEEGTWTPSIGGNATYTTQVGSYTKIGRQVTLWFDLTINVLGTGSTQFISGVPFVPAILIGYHSGTVYWESIAINEIALNVVCQESSGTIWFIGKSAAGASVDNQVAVIGTGARFRGTLTYNV